MTKEIDKLSIVSHEMRTPLTIMKESLSQMLAGIHGDITVNQKKILSTSLSSIERLNRLANDILDVSKFEAGRASLNTELIDVVELANDAVYSFETFAKSRGIKVKLEASAKKIEVFADRDKLMQVLVNLIGNAVKFTEKGSVIISVSDKKGCLECSVSDTGCGIAKDNMAHLFEKFRQFDKPVNAGDPSTGLGLAICKMIVEMHGGTIKAKSPSVLKSAYGQGTTFTFIIPKLAQEMNKFLKVSE